MKNLFVILATAASNFNYYNNIGHDISFTNHYFFCINVHIFTSKVFRAFWTKILKHKLIFDHKGLTQRHDVISFSVSTSVKLVDSSSVSRRLSVILALSKSSDKSD